MNFSDDESQLCYVEDVRAHTNRFLRPLGPCLVSELIQFFTPLLFLNSFQARARRRATRLN